MAIVAGVNFGTLSVRVSLLANDWGRIASCSAEYPLHRRRDNPDFATQSHEDHTRALWSAMQGVIAQATIYGH